MDSAQLQTEEELSDSVVDAAQDLTGASNTVVTGGVEVSEEGVVNTDRAGDGLSDDAPQDDSATDFALSDETPRTDSASSNDSPEEGSPTDGTAQHLTDASNHDEERLRELTEDEFDQRLADFWDREHLSEEAVT